MLRGLVKHNINLDLHTTSLWLLIFTGDSWLTVIPCRSAPGFFQVTAVNLTILEDRYSPSPLHSASNPNIRLRGLARQNLINPDGSWLADHAANSSSPQ